MDDVAQDPWGWKIHCSKYYKTRMAFSANNMNLIASN